MSHEDFQRAYADLIRQPAQCRALNSGQTVMLDHYTLDVDERQRLQFLARHHGMQVNCMLYRASRLVGITRRLPFTIDLLGTRFRAVFDDYLMQQPDAPAEFDQEAQHFAQFIGLCLQRREQHWPDVDQLRESLARELRALSSENASDTASQRAPERYG